MIYMINDSPPSVLETSLHCGSLSSFMPWESLSNEADGHFINTEIY